MKWIWAPLLLLVGSLAWAEVRIVGETRVGPNRLVRLEATTDSKETQFLWDVTPETADIQEQGGRLVFTGPAGTYKVAVTAIDFTAKKVDRARVTVTIGEPGPVPPGPVPPGPTPPVPPVPPPSPAPIPLDGLRVLIVYESAELSKLPAAQATVMYTKQIRDYLNAKCPVGPDGKQREWWMLDKDVDVSGLAKHWQDVMAKSKSHKEFKTPWLVVSNHPKGGYEGPLPANVQEMMSLLRKWGD